MSRIRSIHPGLWTDEAFVSLSPMARLFLMGLWNECDDMGSFSWTPLGLKMRILPADNVDAVALLTEIEGAGIVLRYTVAGKAYGAVRNFCQYQRPKKPNSTCPQTDEVREWVNTEARSMRDGGEPVPNQSETPPEKARQMEDGGGDKEDCSDEQSSAEPRAARGGKKMIPEDWTPPPVAELPPRSRALAEQWTEASYLTEAEGFVLYWRNERKMRPDWKATWANRIIMRHEAVMRAQKYGNDPPAVPRYVAPKTPEEARAWYLTNADCFEAQGNLEMAERSRAHAKAIEDEHPELRGKVSSIVRKVGNSLAA